MFWWECYVGLAITTFAAFSQNWGILADFRCHGQIPELKAHNSCRGGNYMKTPWRAKSEKPCMLVFVRAGEIVLRDCLFFSVCLILVLYNVVNIAKKNEVLFRRDSTWPKFCYFWFSYWGTCVFFC